MERAARKNMFVTAVMLALIGAFTSFELFLYNKPENPLLSESAVSVMLMLSLLFLLFRKAERITEHPIFSWILVSAYLTLGIMLVFPNVYIYKYYLYLICPVLVAGFVGISFSVMMLLGMLGIISFTVGIDIRLILFFFIALISSLNLASEKAKGDLIRQTVGIFAIEAVMILLTGKYIGSRDIYLPGAIITVIFFIMSTIVFLIRSNDMLIWSAFNYSLFDEVEEPVAVPVLKEDESVTEYTLAELCDENAYYRRMIKQSLPNTADRDERMALYARKVAGYTGADLEFVQCACMYRNICKLAGQGVSEEDYIKGLKMPEKLKQFILKERTAGWRPVNFEQIICFAVTETFSAYYYLKKQNRDCDTSQIVDSVCTLLLQKGIARDCLIPMSLFYRMKQGLTGFIPEFINEKKGDK